MPMQQPQTAQPQKPPKPTQDLNISEIDLSQVPVADLIELKKKLDVLLSRDSRDIGANDLVLEYEVKLRTKDGVISNNAGTHRLNAILHQRLLSEAPSRFESAFMQNIFSPINADAYDLFDSSSTSSNPLSGIRSQALPGMLGGYNSLPGE